VQTDDVTALDVDLGVSAMLDALDLKAGVTQDSEGVA
jgi:hypothetical protein